MVLERDVDDVAKEDKVKSGPGSIVLPFIYEKREEVLKMAEVGISIAAKVAEYTVDPLVTQLGYMWKYKSNFKNLEKQVQKLEGTHAMVQHSVEEATRNGEEIERKVVNWLDNVKEINEEATKIIENNNSANMRCFKSLCPDLKKRYQHSKNAANKADDVSELEKQGKFHKVSYRTTPEEMITRTLNQEGPLWRMY
ncbi:hypothetical protein EZV62_004520 [Acer yangbiense]|uniref:Uncharacterized protein n=1 Tax=Acer yangbiense TaxID=1000413 RepID=A0A5C7IK99_9ROSI|nr:hypothetical protein EZV62_004520 [Acer yangbiense]